MERTALLQADYLDILFDHRNKNYGGYELRKHYSQRAFKATVITLSVIVLLVAGNAIAGKFKHETAIIPPVIRTTDITALKVDLPRPKLDLPKPVAPPAVKPTVTWVTPKIVKDELVTEPPKTIKDLVDKTPGITDSKGDPNALDPALKKTMITGDGPAKFAEPKPKILTYVEQMPQFEGDLSTYLASHIRYPEMAKENNIEGRVSIKFVVNEDGSIAAAEVLRGIGGGCDEEALRVLNTMPKWKPGKQNGTPVKVYFTLPIVFKLG